MSEADSVNSSPNVGDLKVSDIPSNWTFEDAKVADAFQRHVRLQLPWYDLATGAVAHIARHYIPLGGRVYDIGASVGNIGNCIGRVLTERKADFVAIESSAEMANVYRGPDKLVVADAMTYKFEEFDCAILFLTVMFMPVATRLSWLKKLVDKIKPGGAIIIFDKFLPPPGNPYVGTILRRLTLAGKVSTGTPSDEIIAKELSIGGVQRPLEHQHFADLGTRAHRVFQFGEFAGYVIERGEGGQP